MMANHWIWGQHGPTIFIVLHPVRFRSLIEFKLQRWFPLDLNQFMSLSCLQRKHEITELYNPLTIILNTSKGTLGEMYWTHSWLGSVIGNVQTLPALRLRLWAERRCCRKPSVSFQQFKGSSKFPIIQVWDHSNLQIGIENNKSH